MQGQASIVYDWALDFTEKAWLYAKSSLALFGIGKRKRYQEKGKNLGTYLDTCFV